jgi:hypothetical protein
MVDGHVVLDDGASCGWFSTDDVFFGFFLCVGSRIFCELIFAGCAHNVNHVAGLEIIDMAAAGSWRLVIPLAGLLFVDWGWPARRSASDPGGNEDWPRRSTDKQHVLGVLLMALLKSEDSSSAQVSAVSFVPDDLYCGRWRKSGLRQRWSATAMGTGCSCKGSACFSFIQECPVKGLFVTVLF